MAEHEFRTWSEGKADAFERPQWPVPLACARPRHPARRRDDGRLADRLPVGGMMSWGLSGAALARGHFEGIALHMVAHGGLVHIVMNVIVLVAISGAIVARLGDPPASWARYAAVVRAERARRRRPLRPDPSAWRGADGGGVGGEFTALVGLLAAACRPAGSR